MSIQDSLTIKRMNKQETKNSEKKLREKFKKLFYLYNWNIDSYKEEKAVGE